MHNSDPMPFDQSPRFRTAALTVRSGRPTFGDALAVGFRTRRDGGGLSAADPDDEPIIFEAVLATEAPILVTETAGMYRGCRHEEVLLLDGIDLSRTKSAPLPMLYGNNVHDMPVGWWEDIGIGESENSRAGVLTRAEGTVSAKDGPTNSIRTVRTAVRNKTLSGVSVGYKILEAVRIRAGESWVG